MSKQPFNHQRDGEVPFLLHVRGSLQRMWYRMLPQEGKKRMWSDVLQHIDVEHFDAEHFDGTSLDVDTYNAYVRYQPYYSVLLRDKPHELLKDLSITQIAGLLQMHPYQDALFFGISRLSPDDGLYTRCMDAMALALVHVQSTRYPYVLFRSFFNHDPKMVETILVRTFSLLEDYPKEHIQHYLDTKTVGSVSISLLARPEYSGLYPNIRQALYDPKNDYFVHCMLNHRAWAFQEYDSSFLRWCIHPVADRSFAEQLQLYLSQSIYDVVMGHYTMRRMRAEQLAQVAYRTWCGTTSENQQSAHADYTVAMAFLGFDAQARILDPAALLHMPAPQQFAWLLGRINLGEPYTTMGFDPKVWQYMTICEDLGVSLQCLSLETIHQLSVPMHLPMDHALDYTVCV